MHRGSEEIRAAMQSSWRAQKNLAILRVLAKNAIDFGTRFGTAIVGIWKFWSDASPT